MLQKRIQCASRRSKFCQLIYVFLSSTYFSVLHSRKLLLTLHQVVYENPKNFLVKECIKSSSSTPNCYNQNKMTSSPKKDLGCGSFTSISLTSSSEPGTGLAQSYYMRKHLSFSVTQQYPGPVMSTSHGSSHSVDIKPPCDRHVPYFVEEQTEM